MATSTTLDQARAKYAANGQEMTAELDALRAAAAKAEQAAYEAKVAFEAAERLSTYRLQQVAADETTGGGWRREAQALLAAPAVDTIARRRRVLGIAHTGVNLGLWGRHSEAVHYAAADLTRMIESGREAEEHYTERTARQACEADRIGREARFQAAVQRLG